MTATDQTIPQPETTFPSGVRRWRWFDDNHDDFLIDSNSGGRPDRAVLVAAADRGTWLSSDQCREAAAVLLALADEAERQGR